METETARRLKIKRKKEKKMFDDAENKIKGTAKVLFWLGMVATFILAVVFGKDRGDDFLFWKFFLILAVGGGAVYVQSLCLYGFGELIGRSCSISRKLGDIEK